MVKTVRNCTEMFNKVQESATAYYFPQQKFLHISPFTHNNTWVWFNGGRKCAVRIYVGGVGEGEVVKANGIKHKRGQNGCFVPIPLFDTHSHQTVPRYCYYDRLTEDFSPVKP